MVSLTIAECLAGLDGHEGGVGIRGSSERARRGNVAVGLSDRIKQHIMQSLTYNILPTSKCREGRLETKIYCAVLEPLRSGCKVRCHEQIC
jgi:hypothetical protein